ncbi:MAG: hypothetical protein ABI434_16450 [Burkholderiaceae bacterium]
MSPITRAQSRFMTSPIALRWSRKTTTAAFVALGLANNFVARRFISGLEKFEKSCFGHQSRDMTTSLKQ